MRTWLFLFCLLFTTGAIAAEPIAESDPAFWRFAHPNARLLVGLKISGTPIAKMVADFRKTTKELPPQANGFFEIFDQIDNVLISAGVPREGSTDSPSLVTLRGNFNLVKLRTLLTSNMSQGKFSQYQGVPVLEMTAQEVNAMAPSEVGGVQISKQLNLKKDSALALIDAATLVMGDPLSVRQAIDHSKDNQKLKVRYPMFVKARSMASTYDYWAVFDIPAPKPVSASEPATPGNAMMAGIGRNMRGLDFGLNLREGMDLQANLHMATAKDAQGFGQMLMAFMPMLASQRLASPKTTAAGDPLPPEQIADQERRAAQIASVMEKVKVMQEDTAVVVRLTLNQEELEAIKKEMKFDKMIKSLPSGGMLGLPASPGTVSEAKPMPEPDAPKQKQVIRIYGLDDGVKEIPVEPKKP